MSAGRHGAQRRRPVAGIVAAAGASQRMGQPKALLRVGGKSFLETIVGAMLDAGLDEVCIVLPPAADAPAAGLARAAFAGEPRVRQVANRWMERGYSGAIQSALDALPPMAAWALTPVDAPFTTPALLRALRDTLFGRDVGAGTASARLPPSAAPGPDPDDEPEAWAVVPITGAGPGHPVLLHARCEALLRRAHEEGGPRGVLARAGIRCRELPWPDPRIAWDLNTPEALRAAGLSWPVPAPGD